MPSAASRSAMFDTRGKYILIFFLALLIYAGGQVAFLNSVFIQLDLPDNDDMMRLLAVRDWLAGQSWFDMTQYRAVPGEGVSLHWSRYVDAALGGLMRVFTPLTGQLVAERLAVVVWPVTLFFVFLLISGQFARSLFGLQAASFTLMAVASLPILHDYFRVGRIDHHNVQMLSMMVIVGSIASNTAPFRMGALAGLVAAFSLAIGLESLFFVFGSGMVLVILYVLNGATERHRLLGFGLGLGLATPLFHVGQTAQREWFVSVCDKLSQPILSVTSAAAMVALVIFFLGRSDRMVVRTTIAFVASLGAFTPLFKQVMFCATGPYGNLPEELRATAMGMITEAASIQYIAQKSFASALNMALPAVVTLAAGLTTFWLVCPVKRIVGERRSFGILLFFLAFSIFGMFYQIRLFASVYAVQPFVLGVTVSWLLRRNAAVQNISLTLLIFVTISSTILVSPLSGALHYIQSSLITIRSEKETLVQVLFDNDCRKNSALHPLNSIPPATILSSVNIGPSLMLHTHHSSLSVPYHRSTPAIRNGFETFLLGQETFETAVRAAGAEFVLVCRDTRYGDRTVTQGLARGESPNWLSLVLLRDTPVILYRVLPKGEAR